MTTHPKVFISYSHDAPAHKKWVGTLGHKLIENGVDVILDQWELHPGDDVPAFMEKNLKECDYVLLICSKNYVTKANSGEGGVGYEKMIVTAEMVKKMDSGKFIPVIRQTGTKDVPTFISSKLYVDLSNDATFEADYDDLLRAIFKTTLSVKPPLGTPPTSLGRKKATTEQNHELPEYAYNILATMIIKYDSTGSNYFPIDTIRGFSLGIGVVGIYRNLQILIDKKLISKYTETAYQLTTLAVEFGVENKIVKG